MPPWIAAVALTLIALFYLPMIAVAAWVAYTGLVRGEVSWRARSGFAWHARGTAARFGGFCMLLVVLGLVFPIVREFVF